MMKTGHEPPSPMEHNDKKKIKELIERFASDDYDRELLGKFQGWVGSEANGEAKDEALFEIWNRTPSTGSRSHAREVFRAVSRRAGIAVDGGKRRIDRRLALRIAAVIAVPLVLIPAIWFYVDRQAPVAVGYVEAQENSEGSQSVERYMLLADGSEVWAQGETLIAADGDRENSLVGDALYNVKREYLGGRRFTVKTEHLRATVLGTVFRVTALPGSDRTIVTLYEGMLEISIEQGEFRIDSGKRFTYYNDTGDYIIEDIGEIWPEQIGDGVVTYCSEEIASVFREIGELYGVTVDYGGYSWASEKVTLKFTSVSNLENVLYMLSGISGNFGYRITDDKVFIYNR